MPCSHDGADTRVSAVSKTSLSIVVCSIWSCLPNGSYLLSPLYSVVHSRFTRNLLSWLASRSLDATLHYISGNAVVLQALHFALLRLTSTGRLFFSKTACQRWEFQSYGRMDERGTMKCHYVMYTFELGDTTDLLPVACGLWGLPFGCSERAGSSNTCSIWKPTTVRQPVAFPWAEV